MNQSEQPKLVSVRCNGVVGVLDVGQGTINLTTGEACYFSGRQPTSSGNRLHRMLYISVIQGNNCHALTLPRGPLAGVQTGQPLFALIPPMAPQ